MSPLEGALIIVAVLTVSGVGAWWQVRRARAAADIREQILAAPPVPSGIEVWDDHAQQWLTLPPGVQPLLGQYTGADVAALDDLVLAWEADAFDPATDPQWAAGRARLLTDLNDQQGD